MDLTTNALHKHRKLDVLYTDFMKAFDKVSRRKLIPKLRAYGLIKWRETWSMELGPEKYKIMHLGKKYNPEDYFIAGNKTVVTKCERDLYVGCLV